MRNNALYWIQTDHLGRPEGITNQAKQRLWRAATRPFDRKIIDDDIGGFHLGFPGQYHDTETGFAYNIHRNYMPGKGRYLETDPIGLAGGINTYAYAANNPVMFTDPLGLDVTVCLYPGALGFGHVGVGVNSSSTVGFYPQQSSVGMALGLEVPGAVKPDDREAKDCKTYSTTAEQDAAAQRFIDNVTANPQRYQLTGTNCVAFVLAVFGAAGIDIPDTTIRPRPFFDTLP